MNRLRSDPNVPAADYQRFFPFCSIKRQEVFQLLLDRMPTLYRPVTLTHLEALTGHCYLLRGLAGELHCESILSFKNKTQKAPTITASSLFRISRKKQPTKHILDSSKKMELHDSLVRYLILLLTLHLFHNGGHHWHDFHSRFRNAYKLPFSVSPLRKSIQHVVESRAAN